MINRTDIFQKFHPGFARVDSPHLITLHGTGGGVDAEALFKWYETLPTLTDKWSINRTANLNRGIGMYHYLIDRDGTVYEMLNELKWAYHSHAGRNDRATLGIELINPDRSNGFQYTDEQYTALNNLISNINLRHTIKGIESHNYRARRYSNLVPPAVTPCPGVGFDWERLNDFGVEVRS